VLCLTTPHGLDDRLGPPVVRRHESGADARRHEAVEATRMSGGQDQERPRPVREADGVHRFLGQRRHDMFLEVPVGVWVVRLGSRTVPEEVHGDEVAAGVLEERRPPVADPGAGEGRAEAME